ncbi:4'-phosphopantetheinyl transferase family protein [Hymenobacter siberiensis]|uniref:4'-phosphopantetheinyl transferase family protein n=1 Tax=Hymenobacter siberiensis TaxID=2848396 RepID=UPI001C1E45CA|nr:4'-phosphopantetheinyl transferase superfamily protein [Hymenobacter siberiensis]MBU6123335.1 4'-phosphopantetheinyl transferase superfamily protein [Hymenobacter siberiensis]
MLVRAVVAASPLPFYHCWRTRLGPVTPAALAKLSAAEQARHARFLAAGPAQAYAGAHVFLRAVLGHYTHQPPAALALGVDARQKPILTTDPPLWFNLSYRADWALLAVSNQGEVGVDLEAIRPVAGAAALVDYLFSPAERAVLRAAGRSAWRALFYAIWTRKEAWAKCSGMGLALPFAGFSVARRRGSAIAWQVPGPGQLQGFAVNEDHAGALACAAPTAVCWQHFDFPSRLPVAAIPFPR